MVTVMKNIISLLLFFKMVIILEKTLFFTTLTVFENGVKNTGFKHHLIISK